MKEKWIVLMLFSLVLPFCMSFAAAAEPTSNQTMVADQKTVAENTATNKNIRQIENIQMAAGEATSKKPQMEQTTTVSITQSQLIDAASRVNSFTSKNGRLPNYVTINGNQISMAQFLMLTAQGTLDLKNDQNLALTLKDVDLANPNETVIYGSIQKTEYLKLAQNILSFTDKNGRTPSYVNSSIGNISYESLVYMFSKIVVFYDANKRLPNYVSVNPVTYQAAGSPLSSSVLQKYLIATKNCQVTSATIKNLAKSITKGKTTAYAKAKAIFNWVRDHLAYQFYYNTKKGALGALSSRSANCVDTSHLVIALARAAGIPAQYQYAKCHFSNGWFGHVFAQLYVGGKWYYADASNNQNCFGTIKSWNLKTYIFYHNYASLPF